MATSKWDPAVNGYVKALVDPFAAIQASFGEETLLDLA
jgi:hypothetical protein